MLSETELAPAPPAPAESAPSPEKRRPVNLASVTACAAPILMLAVLGWHRRWVSDDGWINIRVVEQFLAGNGPVYNIGERVEVTTSTLWFWFLLGGALAFPSVEPQITGAVVGWALTIAGFIAASLGAAQLFRIRRPIAFVPVGTLAMAALPPMWDFTTSGLETGLSFAWLGSCFWLLARRTVAYEKGVRKPCWWPLHLPFLIGLGPLIRPDFALYSALFAIGLLMSSRFKWWDYPLCLLTAIALPGGYEVYRMGYFALLVPNTALAKDASQSHWEQGFLYLVDYAGLYVLVVPFLAAALGTGFHLAYAWRARSQARWAVVGAPLLGGLLHALYIIRVGGDFMHARFLLPDTFAILMPAAVVGVSVARRQLILVSAALVAGWAIVIASSVRTPYAGGISKIGIADERAFWSKAAGTGQILSRHDWSATELGRNGRRARWNHETGWSYYDAGGKRLPTADGTGVYVTTTNLGYYSIAAGVEVSLVDMVSLSDGITSHSTLDPRLHDRARVGHAERPEAWRRARYARFDPTEPDDVTHAREALRCGDLRILQDAITGPMTKEKFWANVRLAPRLTQFQFPADPALARKELCGWNPGW